MIDLEKEAEEYADFSNDYIAMSFGDKFNEGSKRDFIAGANSKYVQAKIIQAQIDLLCKYQQKLGGYEPISGALKQDIQIDIYQLQQQLNKLTR